ncbi:MAG: DUF3137 domain-containing protein, partial [Clostridia bacterium]|nr:DUF3137 domain-containing protein [Clostridia bacterium]
TEVYEQLKKMKSKTEISAIAVFVSFGLTIAFAFIYGPLAFIGFGMVALSIVAYNKFNKEYTTYYKDNVVRKITAEDCDFLENFCFIPEAGIEPDEIYYLNAIYGDIFRSNDLITAKYKGVGFRQSDVYIGTYSHSSDGPSETTYFMGRWMIFDFNKEFNWNMHVVSKWFYSAKALTSGIGDKLGFVEEGVGVPKNHVRLENDEFNKTYKVYAENEQEAFYILTPHVVEALMNLKKAIRGHLMFIFAGGKLHVAVFNNRDAFEGKVFGNMDFDEEKKRILGDIKLITDFIDELSLDRDLFKQ